MRTFITIAAGVLLALTCVTSSDARQHANQPRPVQSGPTYYGRITTIQRGRDSSCFYSTGLPELYACSANGGG